MLIPLGKKDYWNIQPPAGDSQFASYTEHPELAGLLNVLYPGVFPNVGELRPNRSAPRRPGGDPVDRDPSGHRPGVPELHGAHSS